MMWWIGLGISVIGLAGLAYTRWEYRQARLFVERLRRELPAGTCVVCSYWRYGLNHGHRVEPRPTPHDCCEAQRAGREAR